MNMGKKYGIIYKITNKINNKAYIGQTVYNINKRWKLHVHSSKLSSSDPNSKSAFHAAIRKYKEHNFDVEIICYGNSAEELNELEKFYINKFNAITPNGYNLKEGGEAGKWSPEAIKRITEVRQKRFSESPELREKMANNFNSYRSQLTKEEESLILSSISKSYWTEDNRKKKASVEKERWSTLTAEQKDQRLKALLEHNKLYWTEDNIKSHGDKIKKSNKYRNSNHTQKMIEKCAIKIKVTDIKNKETLIFPSKAKTCRFLKMTASTLNDILNGKRSKEYKGYIFETIQ